ncbi:hypothetical protein Pelo_9289 [Pelomyxa schiedti]|nr:hypothetical protein Pelo_9289 [Pelomyxa schiedti]
MSKLPALPSWTGEDLCDLCQATIDELISKAQRADIWSVVKSGDGVTVSRADIRPGTEPRPSTFKTVALLNAPMNKVLESLWDPVSHQELDNTFKILESIYTIDPCATHSGRTWRRDIVHVVTNPAVGGWISSRDYVDCRVMSDVPPLSSYPTCRAAVLCSQAYEGVSLTPAQGSVRAKNYPSGVIFREVDPNTTEITEIVCTDLRGSLPGWAVAAGMSGTRLAFVNSFRAWLKNH